MPNSLRFVSAFAIAGACAALGCSAGPGGGSGVDGASGSPGGANGGAGNGTAQGGTPPLVITQGGSNTGGSGGETCASDSHEASAVPISMYVLLDQSGSMTLDQDRWTPVTAALKAFVSGPSLSGLGIGLQYFPLGASKTEDPAICLAGNYAQPAVPVADLPANAAAIVASIDAHHFTAAEGEDAAHWGTPTLPALEGSYAAIRAHLQANPTRRGVLLLATDGAPSKLCDGNSADGVTEAIRTAAAATPPIQTYVIGIGSVGNLNDWADAGGTGHAAFIVDGAGQTTETELAMALNQIRLLTLPCDYAIPAQTTVAFDPQKVNVQLSSGASSAVVPRVASMTACDATTPTWYFDDPAHPTRVVMCPVACDALHQPSAKLDLLFGCPTEVYIPK